MALRSFVTDDWADPLTKPRYTTMAVSSAAAAEQQRSRGVGSAFVGTASRLLEPRLAAMPAGPAAPGAAEAPAPHRIGGPPSADDGAVTPAMTQEASESLPQLVEEAKSLAQRLQDLRLHTEASRMLGICRDLQARDRVWLGAGVSPHLVCTAAGITSNAPLFPATVDSSEADRWLTTSQRFHRNPANVVRESVAVTPRDINATLDEDFPPKRSAEHTHRGGAWVVETHNPGR
mmetsp:Transcript_59349/g.165719  ORF Transcript_59349/g.165719 Transcript_59349/m.165719 type:complete len:233 (+) Transcript_59349:105-803(+)